MPELTAPQGSPADTRRSKSMGHLIIHEAPAAAVALIGKALLAAGVIDEVGTYVCYIDTHDWSAVDVQIQASAVTGTVEITLDRMYFSGQAVHSQDTGTLTTSAQTLSLTSLNGAQQCRVTLTLGAGDDMEFDAGADATAPDALAEYNGQ